MGKAVSESGYRLCASTSKHEVPDFGMKAKATDGAESRINSEKTWKRIRKKQAGRGHPPMNFGRLVPSDIHRNRQHLLMIGPVAVALSNWWFRRPACKTSSVATGAVEITSPSRELSHEPTPCETLRSWHLHRFLRACTRSHTGPNKAGAAGKEDVIGIDR